MRRSLLKNRRLLLRPPWHKSVMVELSGFPLSFKSCTAL